MNTKLMQLAHSAGLQVGTNSAGMPIIIPIKDGKLCTPEEAIYAFACKIIDDNAASMVELIQHYEDTLVEGLQNREPGLTASNLAGGIAVCRQLKKEFQ